MVVPPTRMTDSKAQLRWLFRDARRRYVAVLSQAERDGLHRDLARVAAPAVRGFSLPGSYAAVGDEIDPVEIEHGFAAVAFPRVDGQGLSFHRSRWDALVPGSFGIPEPLASAPRVAPDLLLVPMVAVTLAGVRLGQGKGFYDRALAALRRAAPVRTVALAWDCQIADALPADAWDIAVDYVATPTRLVDCRAFR
jgi:5-formyltetrahydrofolate cyclo-ligase